MDRDKAILIIGGSALVGAETARALHATGAAVYITVRDTAKGRKAIDEIFQSDPTKKAPIHMITMALDSLYSVRQCAEDFTIASGGKLNLLVCNAGIMARPYALTANGFETQLATNYLGHFLLFQLLKPALLASSTPTHSSRVVMVASESHRQGEVRFDDYHFTKDPSSYHPMKCYGQAKTAAIYMANGIDRRFGAKEIHAWSLHPGAIRSGLQLHLGKMVESMWEIPSVKARVKSLAQGAATIVWAGVAAELEGKGGKWLSNCMEVGPFQGVEGLEVMDEGYASWVFDEEKQDRLWKDSLQMVGVEES